MHNEYPCVLSAVSEIQKLVLGSAPSVAIASQELSMAFAYSLAALNAVHSQQQGWVVSQSVTARQVAGLFSR